MFGISTPDFCFLLCPCPYPRPFNEGKQQSWYTAREDEEEAEAISNSHSFLIHQKREE